MCSLRTRSPRCRSIVSSSSIFKPPRLDLIVLYGCSSKQVSTLKWREIMWFVDLHWRDHFTITHHLQSVRTPYNHFLFKSLYSSNIFRTYSNFFEKSFSEKKSFFFGLSPFFKKKIEIHREKCPIGLLYRWIITYVLVY